MHRISIALLLVPMIQAQQCCVWSGLVAQVNSGSGTAESVNRHRLQPAPAQRLTLGRLVPVAA